MVFSQGLLEHADALTLESPNPKSFMNPTASSASRSRTNASQSHTKRGTAEARYGMSPAPKPVRHKTPPKKQAPVERSPFKSLDRVTRRQSLPPPCPFNEADSMRDDENSLRANESPPQSPAKAKPATQAVPPSPLRPGLLSPVRRPANTKVNAQWISYYVKHGRLAEARKLGWEGPPEGTATATTTSSQPQPPGVELHDSSEDRFARRSSQGVAWTSPGAAPAPAPAPAAAAVATPGSEQGRDPAGGTAFFVRLDAGIEVLRAFANEGTDTGAAVGNDKAAGEEAGAEEWLEAYDKVEATEAEATEAEATEAEVTEEWLAAYDKAEGEAPEEGAPEAWLEADAERLEKQVQRGQPAPGVARAAAKEVAAKVAGLAHWQALASADSHRSHRTEAEENAHAVEAAAATIAATEATAEAAEAAAAAQAQGAPSLVSATCDRAARPRRSRLLVLVLVPVLAAALALAPTLTLPLARTRTLLRTLLRTRCLPPCSLAACAAPRAP